MNGSSGRSGNRHRFEKWRGLINEAVVRGIDPIETDPTTSVYDIEMDGHPSFVANGLLCHNSGTPIYNYGAEIFSVLDALSPGVLGSRGEFYQEWCGGGGGDPTKVSVKDPVALGSYLREAGLMIRRTRKDVGRELRPLTIVRHVVECDTRRIDEAAADVAEIARRVLSRAGSNFELMQWSGEIDLRMRQATGLGKAAGVADLVRLLVESGENVVLYGWHRAVYEIWKSAFERAGITYAMYTGEGLCTFFGFPAE